MLNDEIPLIMPGDTVEFKVQLVELAALDLGLRFTIREGTRTVGGVLL